MSTEFYTVVYRVDGDKAKHDEWWQMIQPLFLSDEPISVVTVGKGDLLEQMNNGPADHG